MKQCKDDCTKCSYLNDISIYKCNIERNNVINKHRFVGIDTYLPDLIYSKSYLENRIGVIISDACAYYNIERYKNLL